MQTIVISLERSQARRAAMAEQLTAAAMPFAFFPAVDGQGSTESAVRYDEGGCLAFLGRPLSPGEIGCFMSHYLVWQECVAAGVPLLVMEDDVVLSPSAARGVAACERLLPSVGLIRLSALRERRGRYVATDDGFTLLRFARRLVGLQCYALTPGAAQRLLAFGERWVEPVDEFVDRFWVHGIDIYGLQPYIAHHRTAESGSEIGAAVRSGRLRGARKMRRELVRIGEGARRESANLRAWFRAARK